MQYKVRVHTITDYVVECTAVDSDDLKDRLTNIHEKFGMAGLDEDLKKNVVGGIVGSHGLEVQEYEAGTD